MIRVASCRDYCQATHLVGRTIRTLDDAPVGHIHDLVLDRANTRVEYAVVATAGRFAFGRGFVALPWHLVEIQGATADEPASVRVRIRHAMLSQGSCLPDLAANGPAAPRWGTLMQLPTRRRGPERNPIVAPQSTCPATTRHRLQDFLGARVIDVDRRAVARLADVLIGAPDGTVDAFVLRQGGSFRLGHRYVCVPAHQLALLRPERHVGVAMPARG
jgi:sporulation protein YlmC with PRC-barrel domain